MDIKTEVVGPGETNSDIPRIPSNQQCGDVKQLSDDHTSLLYKVIKQEVEDFYTENTQNLAEETSLVSCLSDYVQQESLPDPDVKVEIDLAEEKEEINTQIIDLAEVKEEIINTQINSGQAKEESYYCFWCPYENRQLNSTIFHMKVKHEKQVSAVLTGAYDKWKNGYHLNDMEKTLFFRVSPKETTDTTKIKIKNEKKPFTCGVCGKGFCYSKSYLRHEQLCSGKNPYKCDVCGKGFNQRSNCTKHKIVHTDKKPYKCEICGRGFTQSRDLTVHERVHSGEKPYKCDVCGKGFTQNSYLTKHKRTHSGEKPYECDFCGKGFGFNSSLRIHRMVHTGEKPFTCDICGKGFGQSNNYAKHMMTHTDERPYKCGLCGKGYRNNRDLINHKKKYNTNSELNCLKDTHSTTVSASLNTNVPESYVYVSI